MIKLDNEFAYIFLGTKHDMYELNEVMSFSNSEEIKNVQYILIDCKDLSRWAKTIDTFQPLISKLKIFKKLRHSTATYSFFGDL